jgi:hypothetical protein
VLVAVITAAGALVRREANKASLEVCNLPKNTVIDVDAVEIVDCSPENPNGTRRLRCKANRMTGVMHGGWLSASAVEYIGAQCSAANTRAQRCSLDSCAPNVRWWRHA